MSAKVILTMKEGDREVRKLTFGDRLLGVVGRGSSCFVQLPNDLAHLVVSRQHCLLDINPPYAAVQDLGSRNGTYVNGVLIGKRGRGTGPDDTVEDEPALYPLKAGDELRVGDTVFQVAVEAEPEAAEPGGFPFYCGQAGERQLAGSSVHDN